MDLMHASSRGQPLCETDAIAAIVDLGTVLDPDDPRTFTCPRCLLILAHGRRPMRAGEHPDARDQDPAQDVPAPRHTVRASGSATIHWADFSSHDATLNWPGLAAAGLIGAIMKLGDGLNFYRNPYFGPQWNAMRATFPGFHGAYFVVWGNRSLYDQTLWWESLLDANAPGWRNDPGFWVMSDNEPFYDSQTPPTVTQINQLHGIWRERGWPVGAAYGPLWYYGGALSGLSVPWVQSSYGANPNVDYRTAYAQWGGDTSYRWSTAAGVPEVMQYGSRAIFGAVSGGHDVNASRTGLAQTLAMLRGEMDAAMDDLTRMITNIDTYLFKGVMLELDPITELTWGGDVTPKTRSLPNAYIQRAKRVDAALTELRTRAQALAETVASQRISLDAVAAQVDALTTRLDQVSSALDAMSGGAVTGDVVTKADLLEVGQAMIGALGAPTA